MLLHKKLQKAFKVDLQHFEENLTVFLESLLLESCLSEAESYSFATLKSMHLSVSNKKRIELFLKLVFFANISGTP